MRITNRYMASQVLNSIQGNLGKLARSQEQLSTGKRILRPSDDPNVMGEFLKIRATLSYNEQYNRNIDDGLSFLEMSDVSMGTLGNVLDKALEYAIQAANDTYNENDRIAIGEQIDKLIDQVKDLANSTVGGKYIYAGTQNDAPPFERIKDTEGRDMIVYKGNVQEITREVAANTFYRIDEPGITYDPTNPGAPAGVFGKGTYDSTTRVYTVFQYDADGIAQGEGIFKVLFELRDRLMGNKTSDLQISISELQKEKNKLLQHRVAVGARYQHFESLKTQLLDQEVKLTQSLDNIEAADIARLSIEYSQQQLAYNASLAVGAGIMQTSLLNFLK